MKHLNKYLSLALALVLCLSVAACGSNGGDYDDNDDGDDNFYDVPDSFEGLVKDSEQMANLYIYGGAWTGELRPAGDGGQRCQLYAAGRGMGRCGQGLHRCCRCDAGHGCRRGNPDRRPSA